MVNLPVVVTTLDILRFNPLSFSLKNERVPPDLNLKIKRDPAIFYLGPGPLVLLLFMIALTYVHLTFFFFKSTCLKLQCQPGQKMKKRPYQVFGLLEHKMLHKIGRYWRDWLCRQIDWALLSKQIRCDPILTYKMNLAGSPS